jgi:hypothetical protein
LHQPSLPSFCALCAFCGSSPPFGHSSQLVARKMTLIRDVLQLPSQVRKVPKVSRMATSAAHWPNAARSARTRAGRHLGGGHPARSMVSTRLVPMMCSRSNGSCSQHLLGWETFVLRA